MKKLILLRGLPGAGKTTFAYFLANMFDVDVDISVCAADDFFYDEVGEYKFDANKLHLAHAQCQQNVETAMQRGSAVETDWVNGDEIYEPKSVIIVHNTTTSSKEIRTYTDLAKKYNYEVISLVVENRHGNSSVHNVPEEALERMKGRFDVKL